MAPEPAEELLNVYDTEGRVVGAQPRRAAKASGLAVGAVNVLILNDRGQLLMQRRPTDKENGGRWDKSVGGHVSAGEEFDTTAVREAGEELFDDAASPRVRLARDRHEFDALERSEDLTRTVLFHRVSFQLNLRDVRHAPGGGLRNVLYHVAVYAGRTDVALASFRPQAAEITALSYFPAAEVDRLLLERQLAPNMGFLCAWPWPRAFRPGWKTTSTIGPPWPSYSVRARPAWSCSSSAAPSTRTTPGPARWPSPAGARSLATATCGSPPSARPSRRSIWTWRRTASSWGGWTRCGPWPAGAP